jgi:peptidoglycan/xylan/chitin deacetylase (PgdA/CDA1 family)
MSPALAGWLLRGAAAAVDIGAEPRLSVLIFHRVLAEPDALFPHEMHARRFDALMGMLGRAFQVLTIGDAHACRAAGRLPPRAMSITFDDGYADNAELALPILRRHGLAATFFVSTGFLDGGRMWNDTVIEALRACRAESVDLGCLGLGRLSLVGTEQRRTAIDLVLPKVKYMSLQAREQAIADLLAACGHPALPEGLMMRPGQVQALHAAGMEIGGHTVRHPILTTLPDDSAFDEIDRGRRQLQQITDAAVEVFAYPNGRPQRDYDERHARMARRAGFRCAVSTAPGTVTERNDDFHWPRFTPWDPTNLRWMARLLSSRHRHLL